MKMAEVLHKCSKYIKVNKMTEFTTNRGKDLTSEYENLSTMKIDDDAYIDLYNRVLFPYDDDSYFQQRLSGKSRVIRKNEGLHDSIAVALSDSDDASLIAVNELISERDDWLEGAPNQISKIIDHLNFCLDMDSIKVATVGVEAPVDKVTYLMYSRVNRLLASTSPENFDDFFLSAVYLGQRIERTLNATHLEKFDFLDSKMTEVLRNAINISNSRKYIRNFLTDDTRQHDQNEVQTDNDRVRAVFGNIMKTRTHGMSLGYIETDVGGSYIFSDVDTIKSEWERSLPARSFYSLALDVPTVAQTVHSALSRPRYLRPTVKQSTERESQIIVSAPGTKPIAVINIGPDGELYEDLHCNLPISRAAAYFGKYEAYRKLQAEVLGHYYNLTHSTTIDINAIRSAGMSTGTAVRQNEQPVEVLSRLVVPRQIIVPSEDKRNEGDSTPRIIKLHDVVWHRRKLPTGWHPSPTAEKLAAEAGITLEEGETFVRDHRRGSKELGEVVGRRLIKRA